MSSLSLDLAARDVLAHYGFAAPGVAVVRLGNRGGFSGACLWRLQGLPTGELCLRAWPPDGPEPDRLHDIHHLMALAREAGLPFVPAVFPTRRGGTWLEHVGRLWEVTAWMPGRADFRARPTSSRLEAACTALAHLHGVWSQLGMPPRPCPGIQRRLQRARAWIALIEAGWQPQFGTTGDDPVGPWAERAWRLLRLRVNDVPRRLAPWADRPVPIQPCLCDIWHDHVLFEGDRLTGLVDYGGVKLDYVAVDLARLLGSMAGDDAELWAAGLRAYSRLRPLAAEDERLVTVLDETGTLLGAGNWLRWLYREGKRFEDRVATADRLRALVERIQRLQSQALGRASDW